MNTIYEVVNPEVLFFAGIIGLLIVLIVILHFLKNLILKLLGNKNVKLPGAGASIRNLVMTIFFVSICGLLIFVSLFFRAYHSFTYEEPVAEIEVFPAGRQACIIKLTQFIDDSTYVNDYDIKGDQWMIEGDILKWEDYVNFLGLHTRYRLTRIRGRYIKTDDELNKPVTIYSLVEDEDNTFWSVMYDVGVSVPLVSTVYGNAAYQMSKSRKKFKVFVSTSGLVIREEF